MTFLSAWAARAGAALLCLLACGTVAWGQPEPRTEDFVLVPADVRAKDQFGVAIAMDGAVAVATALFDNEPLRGSGAAHVLRFDGAQWVEEAKLIPPDAHPYDAYGIRAALRGDVFVVGAPNKNVRSQLDGAAYVYRFEGGSWQEEAVLTSPHGGYLENFGISVAVGEDLIAIGTPRENDRGQWSGAVWVFRRQGGTWAPTAKLHASNGTVGAAFGWSLALHGDVLVVGATHIYTGAPGEAYVFRFDGTGWTEEARLVPADSAAWDWFGESVSVTDGVIFVGAPSNSPVTWRTGAAYAFRHREGEWVQEARLVPEGTQLREAAGIKVEVRGTRACVSRLANDGGLVSIYTFGLAGWTEELQLAASDRTPFDGFGYGGALADDLALIGALGADVVAENSGAVYGFELPPAPGVDDLLADLAALVEGLGLPAGIEASLLRKLDAARRLHDDARAGNDGAVASLLEAFVREVAALTGSLLPEDDAAQLIQGARSILAVLGQVDG